MLLAQNIDKQYSDCCVDEVFRVDFSSRVLTSDDAENNLDIGSGVVGTESKEGSC